MVWTSWNHKAGYDAGRPKCIFIGEINAIPRVNEYIVLREDFGAERVSSVTYDLVNGDVEISVYSVDGCNDYGPCLYNQEKEKTKWKTPAPMVPKPGEVWELHLSGIFRAFIHKPRRSTEISRIWEDGYASELIDDGMIHGQNGWRLVYSPDPERMRRAQG